MSRKSNNTGSNTGSESNTESYNQGEGGVTWRRRQSSRQYEPQEPQELDYETNPRLKGSALQRGLARIYYPGQGAQIGPRARLSSGLANVVSPPAAWNLSAADVERVREQIRRCGRPVNPDNRYCTVDGAAFANLVSEDQLLALSDAYRRQYPRRFARSDAQRSECAGISQDACNNNAKCYWQGGQNNRCNALPGYFEDEGVPSLTRTRKTICRAADDAASCRVNRDTCLWREADDFCTGKRGGRVVAAHSDRLLTQRGIDELINDPAEFRRVSQAGLAAAGYPATKEEIAQERRRIRRLLRGE